MIHSSEDCRVGRPFDATTAHSTIGFAAIGDHARLPARFFARLCASDGSLPGR